jgi:hypothetical protein
MDLKGRKRKELAVAVGELLGTEPVYKYPPSYAYDIGRVILDRDSKLVFPADMTAEAVRGLVEELQAQGFTVAEVPDNLVIQMPLEGFDAAKLDNLQKLVASKAVLIQQALGVEALPIEQTEAAICFPWFAFDTPAGDVAVYTQFISALCDMAKKQKRVIAVARPIENPKYQFRCFLLRLGFIGDQYAETRRVLLRNLSGNGSLKSGERKPKPAPPEPVPVEAEPTVEGDVPKPKFSLRGLFNSIKTVW